MDSEVLRLVALALGLGVFAAGFGAALCIWRKRVHAESEVEIEALRDEIWELRAAAAARDKAEAASLAKSRFLATVSHEIRTPLNGILGLAQLLGMTRLEAEQASYVESIGACARSLAQLIDDILDFSKIEAGKLELRAESLSWRRWSKAWSNCSRRARKGRRWRSPVSSPEKSPGAWSATPRGCGRC